jgi:hypothetical protein
MTTDQKAKRDQLTVIGRAVACAAVLLIGGFAVVKSNRTADAAPIEAADVYDEYKCPIQPTGDGVAIPDLDPRCI